MAFQSSRKHSAGLLGKAQKHKLLFSLLTPCPAYSSIMSPCNSCLKWFWNAKFSKMGWLQLLAGFLLWVTLLFHVSTEKMYWFYFLTHHREHGVPKPSSASLLPFLWRLGRQQSSHAVNNVAGSLAHIADLAAETGAHGHACPCPAVRHRAHQLPPAESGRGKKEKFLPFTSNLEAFIFCVWNSIMQPSCLLYTKIYPARLLFLQ